MTAQPRRKYLPLAGGAILILAVGISLFWLGQRRGSGTTAEDAPAIGDPETADTQAGTARLFFVAQDGMELVESEQPVEIDAATDSLTRARVILERQLGEAPPPLESPFPPGTALRAVYLTQGGDAFVDLNREVTREHGGGSLGELFTVYALVNALTTNLPEVSAVQILIEGSEVDTLAGHIDLRHPLEQNMKWVAGAAGDSGPEPTAAEGQ